MTWLPSGRSWRSCVAFREFSGSSTTWNCPWPATAIRGSLSVTGFLLPWLAILKNGGRAWFPILPLFGIPEGDCSHIFRSQCRLIAACSCPIISIARESAKMPTQTWTLVDHDQDIYIDQIALGPDQVGGAADGYIVIKRTLQAGLSQGVDVIEVRHGNFRFVVVPTRGMGIWRACLGDLRLGWKSPVRGPVHPVYVRQQHPDGIGWLDGFDEL